MGEGRGVDENEGRAVPPGCMDAVDQYRLGIGLQGFERMSGPGGLFPEQPVDIRESSMTIVVRLADAQKIQVGAIENQ